MLLSLSNHSRIGSSPVVHSIPKVGIVIRGNQREVISGSGAVLVEVVPVDFAVNRSVVIVEGRVKVSVPVVGVARIVIVGFSWLSPCYGFTTALSMLSRFGVLLSRLIISLTAAIRKLHSTICVPNC